MSDDFHKGFILFRRDAFNRGWWFRPEVSRSQPYREYHKFGMCVQFGAFMDTLKNVTPNHRFCSFHVYFNRRMYALNLAFYRDDYFDSIDEWIDFSNNREAPQKKK